MRRRTEPTPEEIESLRAIVEHGTIRLAAKHLHRSRHTVDTHLDRLREKTDLRYLPQLVAWAARNGWLAEEAADA
jgi:DNA-binding CsgD family transcriptional regulator